MNMTYNLLMMPNIQVTKILQNAKSYHGAFYSFLNELSILIWFDVCKLNATIFIQFIVLHFDMTNDKSQKLYSIS